MKYVIKLGPQFKKDFKRLVKKYRSLDMDVEKLGDQLREAPHQGVDLGNGIRKVRMAITAKGKGKSHGARVITYTVIVSETQGTVTLLTIYDKAGQEIISDKEIERLIKELEEY